MISELKMWQIVESQIDFNKATERYFAKKIQEEKHLNYAKQRFSKLMFGRAKCRTRDWTKHKEELYKQLKIYEEFQQLSLSLLQFVLLIYRAKNKES